MEHIDLITISDSECNDDDEVEILDYFYNVEPITVDLTGPPSQTKKTSKQQRARSPTQQAKTHKQHLPESPPRPKASNAQHPNRFQSKPEAQPVFTRADERYQAEPPHEQAPTNTLHSNESTLQQDDSHIQQSNGHPIRHEEIQRPTEPTPQPKETQTEDHRGPPPHSNGTSIQHTTTTPPPPPSPPQNNEAPDIQQHAQQPERPVSDYDLMTMLKERGNKQFRSNNLNEAVRLYREAGELARKLDHKDMSAILHFNLAMSYDKLGSYNQAADECAAAVKIDDKYMKAHCKRAEIYMRQGKFDEAVICYEHICEIDGSKRDEANKRIAHAKELAKSNRKRSQFEILGLKTCFTPEELKKAYKQKARAHHPDRHSDADIVTRRIQEKIFKEASEANAYFRKRYGYN